VADMYRSIGVGIGGAGSWRALAWAIEEAENSGSRLVLIHVCAPGSPLEQSAGEPTPADLELIDPNLARALTNARSRLGLRRAVLKVYSGEPSSRLVGASRGVGLLVIGAGEGDRTVRRTVRQAHCPVVIVRPGAEWSSVGVNHVVAGVDGSTAGRMALEFAFAYADQHRLPLAAVHVMEARGDHAAQEGSGTEAGRKLLTEELQPWVSKYPAVMIKTKVFMASVVDGLVRAGHGSPLLVVGDKRRGVIGRIRTGDVPVIVAMEGPCPVAVVPIEQREGEPL